MSEETGGLVPIKKPFNIERAINLSVEREETGQYTITSDGMLKLGKPELIMHVPQGHYLAAACRIMNDAARYMVEMNVLPDTGQRVQLGPWTIVQFKREGQADNIVVEIQDGSSPEFFE